MAIVDSFMVMVTISYEIDVMIMRSTRSWPVRDHPICEQYIAYLVGGE
jgi:hypothetical protein